MDMTKFSESKFLKAQDIPVDRDTVVTIDRVVVEEMQDGGKKPVVYFRGAKKGLVLNLVNNNALIRIYGGDSDGWTGQPIALYVDENVTFKGQSMPGLRVRRVQQQAGAAPAAAPQPQQQPQPQPGGEGIDAGESIPF